jgi:histidine ammonia-lyase
MPTLALVRPGVQTAPGLPMSHLTQEISQPVVVGPSPLDIDTLIRVAVQGAKVRLADDPAWLRKMDACEARLAKAVADGTPIYGVTTGFGSNCGARISGETALALGDGLLRFHGCGTGPDLPVAALRGAMLCRILCLGLGYSGVRVALLQRLADFLNHGITPVVPAQGSVGASGDLTPMSYVAAALIGQREVDFQGKRMAAAAAIKAAGLPAFEFAVKEPISIINGTPIMTGIAVMVVDQCRRILAAATRATAMAVHAMAGHEHHLHPILFEAKPFPGQAAVAARLRALVRAEGDVHEAEVPESLQDPYSLRCAPHVLGVLADALAWVERWVEIEGSGASDNPLFDPESGVPLMGGNFYGGHIAFAMDAVKAAVGSVADLCDRQAALLVDPRYSRGLPAQLAPPGENGSAPRHGFKGMQITLSALTAEALQASMPVASFSRSTESHNQDKVSMGTIAAREALRVCELGGHAVAVHLLTVAQACELRGGLPGRPAIAATVEAIRGLSRALTDDRPLDRDIEAVYEAIAAGALGQPLPVEA